MVIKILIVNSGDQDGRLYCEHGLSVYVENCGQRFLIDTGQSSKFIENARLLNIDLALVDYVVITHGHYDHINGLPGFLKVNQKAKIIISPQVFENDFFSVKQDSVKNIGKNFDKELIDPSRLIYLDEDAGFGGGLYVLARANGAGPGHGKFIIKSGEKETTDDFTHEIIPYFDIQEGIVVFTGCAHQGLFNILDSIRNKVSPRKIVAAIGGYHLPDSLSKAEVNNLVNLLETHFPETTFYTGHCTGAVAFSLMKPILKDRLLPIHSGSTITFKSYRNEKNCFTSYNKFSD